MWSLRLQGIARFDLWGLSYVRGFELGSACVALGQDRVVLGCAVLVPGFFQQVAEGLEDPFGDRRFKSSAYVTAPGFVALVRTMRDQVCCEPVCGVSWELVVSAASRIVVEQLADAGVISGEAAELARVPGHVLRERCREVSSAWSASLGSGSQVRSSGSSCGYGDQLGQELAADSEAGSPVPWA